MAQQMTDAVMIEATSRSPAFVPAANPIIVTAGWAIWHIPPFFLSVARTGP
jgi:hypothetical protein